MLQGFNNLFSHQVFAKIHWLIIQIIILVSLIIGGYKYLRNELNSIDAPKPPAVTQPASQGEAPAKDKGGGR